MFYDILSPHQAFKTSVGSQGMVMEVGEKHPAEITVRDHITCELSQYRDSERVHEPITWVYFPNDEGVFIRQQPKLLDIVFYGEKVQVLELCYVTADTQIKYNRITNIYKIHPINELATIYHYDGVTIDINKNAEGKSEIQITEIKYYRQKGNTNDEELLVRFEGIVEKACGNHEKLSKKGRDIDYYLDLPIVRFTNGLHPDKGIIFEIGSDVDSIIENQSEVEVKCEQVANHKLNEAYTTTVCTNFDEEPSKTAKKRLDKKHPWGVIDEKYEGHIYTRSQKLWNCMRNGELVFHRVLNQMVFTEKMRISHIFYAKNVNVESLQLPDGKTVFQATELKLIRTTPQEDQKEMIEVIEYQGELTLITIRDLVFDRLFHADVNNHLKQGQLARGVYWPYLILDAYNMKKLKIIKNYIGFEPISAGKSESFFEKLLNYIQTKIFRSSGRSSKENSAFELAAIDYKTSGGVIEVGHSHTVLKVVSQTPIRVMLPPWEDHSQNRLAIAGCLKDNFNPDFPLRYLPSIFSYTDDKIFELDEAQIRRKFKIKTDVWLCDDGKNKFIKVMQTLSSKVLLNSVIYSGNVQVVKDQSSRNVIITVHSIIDEQTREPAQYTGRTVQIPYPEESAIKKYMEKAWKFIASSGRELVVATRRLIRTILYKK